MGRNILFFPGFVNAFFGVALERGQRHSRLPRIIDRVDADDMEVKHSHWCSLLERFAVADTKSWIFAFAGMLSPLSCPHPPMRGQAPAGIQCLLQHVVHTDENSSMRWTAVRAYECPMGCFRSTSHSRVGRNT